MSIFSRKPIKHQMNGQALWLNVSSVTKDTNPSFWKITAKYSIVKYNFKLFW